MAVNSAYLRQEPASNHTWILVALGLLGFAVASGVALAQGELDAFFVALAVIGAMAVMFDFRVGAVLLLCMLPLYDTAVFPHAALGVTGLNPVNLLVLATALSYLVHGGRFGDLAPKPLLWLFAVPILLAGLNGIPHIHQIAPVFFETNTFQFTSPFGYMMQFALKPLVIVAIAMLVGVAAARSQKPESFLVPIMVSLAIIALIQLGFIIASGTRLGHLASSSARTFYNALGTHANDLGRLFAVAYALLLFVWWETKDSALKTALFLTMGLIVLALLLSFSRGAFLGFFVVNALFLLWKFNSRTLMVALAAAAIFTLLAPDYLWGRITMGFASGNANEVSADRVEGIWMPLLPELFKAPLWGNGLGFTTWSPPMLAGAMNVAGHPHNAYMEAVLDMGAIGLALLIAFYFHVWKTLRKLGSNPFLSPEMRALFQGGTAALICCLITGMSGSSLRPESEFAYLWVAIGLMYGMRSRKPLTTN